MLRKILLVATVLACSALSAHAAQVVKSADPECRVDITGPIVDGDFARVQALQEHLLVNDADGSYPSIVCLDSPGGSVFDGLQIAQFILDNGVSTRIRANKRCYSICAVMFMMGNVQGPEAEHINRRMHVTSKLGFHRPNITAQEAAVYTAGELEAAFDYALLTLLEMMNLAIQNEPWGSGQMMEADLVRIMIETPPHEIHLVEKIEEITRWNIRVDDLPLVNETTGSHLHFACENMLAHEVSLPSALNRADSMLSSAVFDLAPNNGRDLEYITAPPEPEPTVRGYEVLSARTGEAFVWCHIDLERDLVIVCGVDGETNFRLGDCDDSDDWRYHRQDVLYHPASTLRALARTKGQSVEAATTRHCRAELFDLNLSMEEECLQVLQFRSVDDGYLVRHILSWPGGIETEVEIITQPFSNESVVLVNGKPGEFRSGEQNETCVRSEEASLLLCLGPSIPDI